MPNPAYERLAAEPLHLRYRTAIVLLGAGAIALIMLWQQSELLQRVDSLFAIITGVGVVMTNVILFARARDQSLEQRIASHRDAWRTIMAADGKPGAGGRLEAIEELAAGGVSLAGLACEGAYLEALKLPPGTILTRARFGPLEHVFTVLTGATMDRVIAKFADFTGADLDEASLRRSILSFAAFGSATFRYANLDGAQLDGATFKGATFERAQLKGANLTHAMGSHVAFACAEFNEARLDNVDLRFCSFAGADLRGVDMHAARFAQCQFSGILWDDRMVVQGAEFEICTDLPPPFVQWASANGAIFT